MPPNAAMLPDTLVDADEVIDWDNIVTRDDTPVDTMFIEKLGRLLTEPLYISWTGPGAGRNFLVNFNVGLFSSPKQPPLVPDLMFSLDVPRDMDPKTKKHRSYFIWVMGKVPELVMEMVSNRRGGEATTKMAAYAGLGVKYYVIFDPDKRLSKTVTCAYQLHEGAYQLMDKWWFADIGLGLTMWHGAFENWTTSWLRWCDEQGNVIPTGPERSIVEQQRAEVERKLAKAERERADRLEERLAKLEARLRNMGGEVNGQ